MRFRSISLCALIWLLPAVAWAAPPETRPLEGLNHAEVPFHAFTGATVVMQPESQVENATLLVRNGMIVAVGNKVDIPPGARVWDMTGRIIYPAFIDPYSEAKLPEAQADRGTSHWNPYVRPQDQIATTYQPNAELNEKYRAQGIATRLVAPSEGIIKGISALVTTADPNRPDPILNPSAAAHFRLTISHSGNRKQFPNSPMGAVALARQTFSDAQWYAAANKAYAAGGPAPRPEVNEALAALEHQMANGQLMVFDAPNELFALRAAQFAQEFKLKHVALRGSGNEYRRLESIAETGLPVIVPVNFPKPPNIASAAAAHAVGLDELMHWDTAPENPARLAAAGVTIAFTSHGLKTQSDFLPQVRLAVKRGLSPTEALRALTLAPAELLGCADRLGSLEPGKAASFLVADADILAEKSRVLQLWIEGHQYIIHENLHHSLAGSWTLAPLGEPPAAATLPSIFKLEVSEEGTLSGTAHGKTSEKKPAEVKLKHVEANRLRLEFTFDARPFGGEGVARFSLPLSLSTPNKRAVVGQLVWPTGEELAVSMQQKPPAKGDASDDTKGDTKPNEQNSNDDDPNRADSEEPKPESKPASYAVNYPLGAYGVEQLPEQPTAVLFKGATVWTAGEAGTLENASVLIENGVITAVGEEFNAPRGATVIDLAGKHLSPGIIDCHSHMATDGGVNESSQAVTAEVRIGDFIDPDDISIYRQLAGGVTTANVLHGSANPIGGQNQVIKLRWGSTPEGMKFTQAPPGIKFALGENVKQSNWGEEYTSRYPQTRMGVDQIIRDSLHRAKAYAAEHKAWKAAPHGMPPRRDYELEALAQVITNERWIHCHSYRQDEILALLNTLDDFEITIGTLQHILEGYKVADAMARHGAMGSTFSDWWAYKFEVYDAIPFNGALMHQQGVVVSFNSDDHELARHLNHEAAKAMKYGNVSAAEAIKFVTLNPAKQLRIEQHVGSLEVGKQADLVVWSSSPLSTLSRCEQTWIEGRKYFDVERDQQLRAEAATRRHMLMQKILASGLEMKQPGEEDDDDSDLWPRADLFCHGHSH